MNRRAPLLPLVLAALRPRAGRAILSAAGVGAAALLILVLLGARRSLETGVRAVAGAPQIEFWIAPHGTDNLIRSSGRLPDDAAEIAGAVPGVLKADPVTRAFVTLEAGPAGSPRRRTLLALGVRGPHGLGGPPRLVSGRRPAGPDEVALDRAAAYALGAGLGDSLRVGDRTVRLTGLTRDTNLLATQFLFFDTTPEEGLLPVSFVAVRLVPGADVRSVARELATRLPFADVFTRDEFVDASLREVTSGFRPLLVLVSSLGLAVAAILVALLLQGLVEERRADVAVLLAMGASRHILAGAVVLHAAVLASCGAAAGSAAAPVLAAILDRFVPTVELAFRLADAFLVLLLFAAAGAAGGLGPLTRLLRVEPLEAFRP